MDDETQGRTKMASPPRSPYGPSPAVCKARPTKSLSELDLDPSCLEHDLGPPSPLRALGQTFLQRFSSAPVLTLPPRHMGAGADNLSVNVPLRPQLSALDVGADAPFAPGVVLRDGATVVRIKPAKPAKPEETTAPHSPDSTWSLFKF